MADLRALLEMRQASPLSFSHDGESLLVGSDVPGTRQLYVVPARGGELRQLTQFDEPVVRAVPPRRPHPAREGRRRERADAAVPVAPSRREAEPLVVDPRFIHASPHVGRDGTLLAYSTNRRNGTTSTSSRATCARGEEQAFELGGWCDVAAISPDGRWIAAERARRAHAATRDIFLLDVATRRGRARDAARGRRRVRLPARGCPTGPAFLAPTNAGRDTFAIGRFDVASRSWSVVLESEWDLDCAADEAGRSVLVGVERGRLLAARASRPARRSSCARRCRCRGAASSSSRCSPATARCSRSRSRRRRSRSTSTSTTSTRTS